MKLQEQNMKDKSFTITKKIAKHGKQVVIIIPSILRKQLHPGSLVEVKIEILEISTR
jgi:antitoxin component of MazEF toxin-antitoxin module